MAIEVGSAYITLGADASQLDSALNELDKKLQSVDTSGFKKAMDEVENSISASIQPLELMDASFVTLQNTIDQAESSGLDIMRAAFDTTAYAAGDLASSSSDVMQQLQSMGQEAEKTAQSVALTADQLKAAKEQADQMSAGLAGAGAAFTALAVVGVATMRDLLNSAAEEQSVVSRLSATIKASGADWGVASGAVEKYTDAMVQMGFNDEASMNALDRLTSVTGDYNKSLAEMPAIANMARAKGMELSQAAFIVGRALEGQVGILRRYGIVLKEGTTPMEAMAEIQRRFAGQTEAFSSTFAGANAKMGAEMDKLKDSLGARLIPAATQAVETFTRFIERLNALPESTKTTIVQVLGVATAFVAVAGPILLVIGLLGKMQVATATTGALVQLASAAGAGVGPIGALATGFTNLAGSLGTAQLAAGTLLTTLTALTALGYLAYKAGELQAQSVRSSALAFRTQNDALLAQNLTQEQYVQKSVAAAQATGYLADAVNQATHGHVTYAATQSQLTELTKQATVAWLVHNEAVTTSVRAFNEAGAGAVEYYGAIEMRAKENEERAKEHLEREKLMTEEGWKSMQKTIGDAADGISQVMTQHYERDIAAKLQSHVQAAQSEMDYSLKRTQLVKEGDAKGLAELDRSHKEEQIRTDLSNKIALIQQKTQDAIELAQAKKQLGQKLMLWVAEGVANQTIKGTTGQAILNGLALTFGAEETSTAQHYLNMYELSKEDVTNNLERAKQISESFAIESAAVVAAAKVRASTSAADAAANAAAIDAAVEAARRALAALGSGAGDGATGGVAGAVAQTVGQVGQEIVGTVNSLLSDIQSVYEKLDAELPSYNIAVPLAKWMNKLVEITNAMWTWAVGQGAGFGDLVRRINKDLLPDLKAWADVTGTIGNLLGNVASISEQLSAKIPAQQLSVTVMLDRLVSITREAGAWVRKNLGAGKVWEDIVGRVQSWIAPLEALGSVLKAFTDISETMSTKTTSAQFTVSDALDKLVAITREAGLWYRHNMGAGKVWEDILVGFQSWADAMKPLLDVMNAYISTSEILAKKTENARRTVSDIFGAVLLLLEEAAKFVQNTEEGKAFEAAMRPFRGENSLTDFFTQLSEVLSPLTTAINAATSLLDAASKSVPNAQLSVGKTFTALSTFITGLEKYLWAGGIMTLISIIQKLDTWGILLADLGVALKPLNDAFSIVKAALDITGYKVPDVQLSVGKAFTALGAFVTSLDTYLWKGINLSTVFSAIQRLSVWATLLTDLATSLKPVSDAFGAVKTALDLAAYKVPDMELFVTKAFGNLLHFVNVLNTYLRDHLLSVLIAIARAEKWEPTLARLALALKPMSDTFSAIKAVLDLAGKDVSDLELGVHDAFSKLLHFVNVLNTYLRDHKLSVEIAIARAEKWAPILNQLTLALKPVSDALGAVSTMLELASKKMPDVSGADFVKLFDTVRGLMMDIMGALTEIDKGRYYSTLDKVIAQFEANAVPILTRLSLALAPLNAALGALNTVAEATSKEFKFGQVNLVRVFNSVRDLMIDVLGALLEIDKGRYYSTLDRVITDFEANAKPVLDKLVLVLKPLSDMLSEVKTISETMKEPLPEAATSIADILGKVKDWLTSVQTALASPEWASIIARLTDDAVKQFGAIASAMQSLASIIQSTMQSTSLLAVYQGGVPDLALTRFQADLHTLLNKLMEVQNWFTLEAMETEAKFATAIGGVIQMASNALGLFRDLGGITFHVSQQKINEFGLRLGQLLESLGKSLAGMSPADIAKLKSLGEGIAPALGAMGTAFTVLVGLASVKMPDTAKMDSFITGIGNLVTKFATITVTPAQTAAISAAEPTLNAVGSMAGAFIGVFKDMKDVPGDITGLTARMTEAISNLMIWVTRQMAEHADWGDAAAWATGIGDGIDKLVDATNSMRGLTPGTFDGTAFFAPLDSMISGAKSRADELGATGGVADQLKAAIAKLQAALAALGGGASSGRNLSGIIGGWHPPASRQEGGYIPSTGTYTLHAGEMVVPAAAAGSLLGLEHLAGSGAALGGGFMSMMVRSINSYIPDLDSALQQIADRMIPHSPIVSGPMAGWNPDTSGAGTPYVQMPQADPPPGYKWQYDWHSRTWKLVPAGPSGGGPAIMYGAAASYAEKAATIVAAPQINISISGPVTAGNKKELNDLKRSITDGIREQMPYIVSETSKAVTQQAKARERYGYVT